jgi:uncharacterized protein (DUF697 family)
MLVEPFKQSILPILVQIGMVMVIYSVTILGYNQIRRPDVAQMVEKLRGYLFGFLLVKGSYLMVMFINNTIDKIVLK